MISNEDPVEILLNTLEDRIDQIEKLLAPGSNIFQLQTKLIPTIAKAEAKVSSLPVDCQATITQLTSILNKSSVQSIPYDIKERFVKSQQNKFDGYVEQLKQIKELKDVLDIPLCIPPKDILPEKIDCGEVIMDLFVKFSKLAEEYHNMITQFNIAMLTLLDR